MDGQQLGSLIGAVFGLIYVLVNAGSLPSGAAVPLQVLGGAAFLAVVMAVSRRSDRRAREHHSFPRGYWQVVAAELVALAGGLAVLNGLLDTPNAGVAWVSFVVGVHFLALAAVFGEPVLRWLGGAVTACGLVGLALAAAGASQAPIAVLSGVIPGALLLASGWWGAHQPTDEASDMHAERVTVRSP